MMGWAMLALVALGAAALLAALRFPWKLWTVAATAVMLGAAGYTWQGSPQLPGQVAQPRALQTQIDPEMIALREDMFGRFNLQDQYFHMADAMSRNGSLGLAAKAMVGAANGAPNDAALWTWAGVTLAASDGNQVSPAARFAFDRAETLAPQHPGPPFFHGVALIREGKFADARPLWVRAVERTPEKATYRPALLARLAALELLLAEQERPGR